MIFSLLVEINEIIPHQGFSLSSFARGICGIVGIFFVAYLFSKNRKAIPWKTVFIGLSIQILLAYSILEISWVQWVFEKIGQVFVSILNFTDAGSEFLFTVLKISGAESLSVIGNVFLGQTESPLLIKAYLPQMNKSEVLLVMIGGMATVAGGVLAAYIDFLGGDNPVLRLQFAKHLLAASVMAAPGAIIISKILFPQTEKIKKEAKVSSQEVGSNALDALSNGTVEGVKLAANIGGMLLVFVALIAMVNGILFQFGDLTNLNDVISNNTVYQSLSIEAILGVLFAPLMWIIGVPWQDLMPMGQLLGIKLAASEFIGYIQLVELKDVSSQIHFQYEKTIIMATYMLCGFANFASIGIQIGGIGGIAPNQRKNLSKFGLMAVLGGTLASLLSACLVGALLG